MATINDGQLCLIIPGASEGQIMNGFRAARGYLAAAGVSISAAYAASLKPEQIEHMGRGAMTDRNAEHYEAWYQARRAAHIAADYPGAPYATVLSTAEGQSFELDAGPHYVVPGDFMIAG